MIINAVSKLNDKKGSSTIAIKKYVINNFYVNQYRLPRITKLLKTANAEGWLIQTSGIGASSGSYFKLPNETKMDKKIVKTKELTKQKMPMKKVPSKFHKASEATKKKTIMISKKRKA
jgi:hypothetical protein